MRAAAALVPALSGGCAARVRSCGHPLGVLQLPRRRVGCDGLRAGRGQGRPALLGRSRRSEEHTSELQSLMRISYAVFCLKKKKKNNIYMKINTYTVQI